jgi:hypothetical protein
MAVVGRAMSIARVNPNVAHDRPIGAGHVRHQSRFCTGNVGGEMPVVIPARRPNS